MSRDQYNLYISNISQRTHEDAILSYFSQFGNIESHTFLKKSSQRYHAAIIITYGLSADIDSIIHHNQHKKFHGHTLLLRRTLPSIRPAFECFMSSNELLISLPDLSHDEQFNEANLRKQFSKYGSIVSCRKVIPYTTFLLDFVDMNSVDCAILDEPHVYKTYELILRKYISPKRMALFHSKKMNFQLEKNRNPFVIGEKIRRLKHSIEAIQLGQKVELRVIKCSFEEKKLKPKRKQIEEITELTVQLRKKWNDLHVNIEEIKEKNNSIQWSMEQNETMRKNIIELCQIKIAEEQKRMNQLKQAIDLLNLF